MLLCRQLFAFCSCTVFTVRHPFAQRDIAFCADINDENCTTRIGIRIRTRIWTRVIDAISVCAHRVCVFQEFVTMSRARDAGTHQCAAVECGNQNAVTSSLHSQLGEQQLNCYTRIQYDGPR